MIIRTSSAWRDTPVLAKMDLSWALAVCGEIVCAFATSARLRPRARSIATLASAGVSANNSAEGVPGGGLTLVGIADENCGGGAGLALAPLGYRDRPDDEPQGRPAAGADHPQGLYHRGLTRLLRPDDTLQRGLQLTVGTMALNVEMFTAQAHAIRLAQQGRGHRIGIQQPALFVEDNGGDRQLVYRSGIDVAFAGHVIQAGVNLRSPGAGAV